ncbi:tripartite tricarboxylate transporter TctB family protein [soil metagenome]
MNDRILESDNREQTIVEQTPEPENLSLWDRYGEAVVALGLIVMGAVVLLEVREIRVPRALTQVGPRVFPSIIGWGLIVVGLWYAVDVLRGHRAASSDDSEDADPSLPADWSTLIGLGIALIAYAALMEPAGFIIASAVMFLLAALSMGSRQYVRDVIVCIVVSTVVYYVFTEWLGIRLPEGLLGPILP